MDSEVLEIDKDYTTQIYYNLFGKKELFDVKIGDIAITYNQQTDKTRDIIQFLLKSADYEHPASFHCRAENWVKYMLKEEVKK